jgi:HEPN domain-containing protein
MDKNEHITYWLETAKSDWETVNILFVNKKYLQSLFFAHLTIEKIAKALFIKFTEEIYPPKTHDIVKLLDKTNQTFDNETLIFLKAFNIYNLEGRYPDYLSNIYQSTTKEKASELIIKIEGIKDCLLKMI